jgi:hypothetical protein
MMDKSYLLHSFLQVHIIAAAPFTSHHKLGNYAEPNPFSWAKHACFDFSSSNFTLQDRILSFFAVSLRLLVLKIVSEGLNQEFLVLEM